MDQFILDEFKAQQKPVFALENGKIRFDADDTLFALSKKHSLNSLAANALVLDDTIVTNLLTPRAPRKKKCAVDFSDYFAANLDNLFCEDEARDIFKRNLAWVERIESYLERFAGKTVLFMFGYAHLSSRYSIVQLLQNLGYTISRATSLDDVHKAQ
jgi:uncharacterized protein YbaP (TraB family)